MPCLSGPGIPNDPTAGTVGDVDDADDVDAKAVGVPANAIEASANVAAVIAAARPARLLVRAEELPVLALLLLVLFRCFQRGLSLVTEFPPSGVDAAPQMWRKP
jgi:hypothetical protein